MDPGFSLVIEPPHYVLRSNAANLRPLFLLALVWTLARYGNRVVRRAEHRCGNIFIRRKTRKFCAAHGSMKERAKRAYQQKRAESSLPERKQRGQRRGVKLAREAIEATKQIQPRGKKTR